jgi:hypothetical protein
MALCGYSRPYRIVFGHLTMTNIKTARRRENTPTKAAGGINPPR